MFRILHLRRKAGRPPGRICFFLLLGNVLTTSGVASAAENWYSDCDFDLADIAQVQNCFGRLRGNVSANCLALDIDRDNYLGLIDFVSWSQAFTGPDATFPFRPSQDAEAEQLALELGTSVQPDSELYERISNDLKAIRAQYPQECSGPDCIPTIHHFPEILMTQLEVQIWNGQPVDEFESLNCFFEGVARFNGRRMGVDHYSVFFPFPINTPLLSDLYRVLPEVRRADAGDVPEYDSLVILVPEAETATGLAYAISYGWTACETGCVRRTTWRFEVDPDGIAHLIWRQDR